MVVATSWQDRVPALKGALVETAIALLGAAGDAARKNPGDASTILPADRLAAVVAIAKADPGPKGASALGWFYYNSGQPAPALPWFKIAVTRAADSLAATPATAAAPATATEAAPPAGDGPAAGSVAGGSGPASTDVALLSKAVEGFALTLRAPRTRRRCRDIRLGLGRSAAWHQRHVGRCRGGSARPRRREGAAGSRPAGPAFGRDGKGPLGLGRIGLRLVRLRASRLGRRRGLVRQTDSPGRPTKKPPSRSSKAMRQACTTSADSGKPSPLPPPAWMTTARGLCAGSTSTASATGWRGRRQALALASDEAERLAAATTASQSANGAQALGWYAYRSRQYPAAVAWFGKSVGWGATEANVFGLALAYRRNRDTEGLARLMSVYGSRFRSLDAFQRVGLNGPDPAVPDFGNLSRGGCAPTGQPGPPRPSVASNADSTDASALLASASGPGRLPPAPPWRRLPRPCPHRPLPRPWRRWILRRSDPVVADRPAPDDQAVAPTNAMASSDGASAKRRPTRGFGRAAREA